MPVNSDPVPACRPRPRRYLKKPVIAALYAAWIVLLCWGGTKLFWWWRLGLLPTEAPDIDAIWNLQYPELYSSGVLKADLAPDDGTYDVLLLGGSVLEQTAPAIERSLA